MGILSVGLLLQLVYLSSFYVCICVMVMMMMVMMIMMCVLLYDDIVIYMCFVCFVPFVCCCFIEFERYIVSCMDG